jgi:prophage antirepressor-like protein
MEAEITDPNCIVKAFQNNNISIIKDEDNKYYFRGSDVAKALEITNIRSSIQNFTNKEKGVRKVDTLGGPQDIILLVYNKKQLHLGFFVNELDAAKAYNNKATELNKESNCKYKINVI